MVYCDYIGKTRFIFRADSVMVLLRRLFGYIAFRDLSFISGSPTSRLESGNHVLVWHGVVDGRARFLSSSSFHSGTA